MEVRQPTRYVSVDLVHYAINVETEQANIEPLTYSCPKKSRDSDKWTIAI